MQMKISQRFCLNNHFTKIDQENYCQNKVIGICMKDSCKLQRFVCSKCINENHLNHQEMISTFEQLEKKISSKFGEPFLDINVFQISQQSEFQEIKQQISDEFDKLETQINQNQKQIKELLDAFMIISKIKDGNIMEINTNEFDILSEIFEYQNINSQLTLHSNLTQLRNNSLFLTKKLKEVQQYINSIQNNIDNQDFRKFIIRNIKQKIISQFYSQHLLDYSLVPSEFQNIKGVKISEIDNNNEIYYGQINEKQKKHGKGMQIIKNGDIIYEGIWEQDQFLWGQKTTFNEKKTECCILQGKMVHKKLNGQGLKLSSLQIEVRGNFIDDKIQGNGIQMINGDRYEGQFYDDKKQGTGTYYFNNGNMYKGSFQDDKIHGKGQLMCYITETVYAGEFRNNKKEGKFDIRHMNGQIEQVFYINDQLDENIQPIIKQPPHVIKGSIFRDKKR